MAEGSCYPISAADALSSTATTGGLPCVRGIACDAHVPIAYFYPPGQRARTDRAGLHRHLRLLADNPRCGGTACQKGVHQRPRHAGAWQACPSSSRRDRPGWRDACRGAEAAEWCRCVCRRPHREPLQGRSLALSNPTGSLLIGRPFFTQDAAVEPEMSEAAGVEHRRLGPLQLFGRLGPEGAF